MFRKGCQLLHMFKSPPGGDGWYLNTTGVSPSLRFKFKSFQAAVAEG